MSLRLIQFRNQDGARQVGLPDNAGARVAVLAGVATVLELAEAAIRDGQSLPDQVAATGSSGEDDYATIIAEGRLLLPVDHPDPVRMLVSGTGLTHLGSADTRDSMHQTLTAEKLTDSMRMFRDGVAGGKPAAGGVGAQPEWFHKGNGRFVVPPEAKLTMPAFAEDGGEEPEIAALYLIGPDGTPHRLGVALGNEFSDHVTERRNYLLLAHSKLRQSSFGPELLVGPVPPDISGRSRIRRGGAILWEKPFLTGEANMSHSLANLEHHHFKYAEHRVPGDVHVHYFGTATLSFADGIKAEPGDVFEIEAPGFGRPLRNTLARAADTTGAVAAHPL